MPVLRFSTPLSRRVGLSYAAIKCNRILEINGKKTVGRHLAKGKMIGMGYLRLNVAEEGAEVTVDAPDRSAEARVTALPFVSLRKT